MLARVPPFAENIILCEPLKDGSGLVGEVIAYKLETCTGEAQINRRKGNKVSTSAESNPPQSAPS